MFSQFSNIVKLTFSNLHFWVFELLSQRVTNNFFCPGSQSKHLIFTPWMNHCFSTSYRQYWFPFVPWQGYKTISALSFGSDTSQHTERSFGLTSLCQVRVKFCSPFSFVPFIQFFSPITRWLGLFSASTHSSGAAMLLI